MKREKNIVCICILIMIGLIIGFTGKAEAKSTNSCKHIYGIESKVDHTYHYKKCMYCKNEVREKHKLDKNGVCYTCKQTHGKGKMTMTNGTYHYYKCKNAKCNQTIKTAHTWEKEKYGRIIKKATCNAKGKLELECTTSGCSRTKTVDIKKTAHKYTIEKNRIDHTYHYRKCVNCGATKAEKHTLKGETCTVCKQVHGKGSMTITDNTYHYYNCKNRDCRGTIKTKHTWENKKYATIIKQATCSETGIREYDCTTAGCNKKKKETIAKDKKKHNYKVVIDLTSNPDVKVNHTYHYKKCTWCKAKVAEKHVMQGNICKICGQIHGIGEIKKTDAKNHYYKCLNEKCTTLSKKAHKYTIIEKKDHNNHYLKCVDCPSIKIEKHNNKGKGKTCSVCGELHKLTVYKTDHEKHYLKCVQNGCGEKKTEKHKLDKKGKCTVCYETHKNVYATNHEYHYIKCTNANCTYKTEPEKHIPNKNGVCNKCKETHKLVTSAKSSKDYITHITKCYMKNCTFEPVEENHIYTTYNTNEKCAKCGRQWGYNIKGLQEKLYNLGYFKGIYSDIKKAKDGVVGENTRNALNEFFKLEGINKEVKKGGIITPDIFKDIQNATRTKDKLLKEYNDKILTSLKSNDLLINALCKENSTQKQIANILLNSNVDSLDINSIKKKISSFDISVLMCLYSNNSYSQGSRDKGRKEIEDVFNNPPRTEEETIKVLNNLKNNRVYFDCSSFASTVMSLGYGINCKTGGNSYNTKTFEDKRKSVFATEQKTNNKKTTIGTKDLKKGELLLSRRSDGTGHIVVCLGGDKAIHTNTEGKPVRYVDLNEAGKKYLTTTGEFVNVYILKH